MGKGKPMTAARSSSAAAFQSQPSDVMVSVGQPGYTGCFICGSKTHDFRGCPNRGPKGGKGKQSSKGVYMVQALEDAGGSSSSSSMARPSMAIDDVWMNQISSPDLQGHAVLDTGATETVTSLAALEAIHRRRTELLGHSDHVEVIPGPGKVFRFGNGMTQSSESFVY